MINLRTEQIHVRYNHNSNNKWDKQTEEMGSVLKQIFQRLSVFLSSWHVLFIQIVHTRKKSLLQQMMGIPL